jgi:hypothetical protein
MAEISVILRVQEVYLVICKLNEKLPSLKKQTVGRRSEDSLLQLLELCITAKHAPSAHKAPYLIKAIALLETTQFHIRIMLDQKLANETTCFQIQAKLSEIGRMLGGWYKSVK